MGFSDKVLKTALAAFQGVQRRFTKVGEVDGIRIIDDYAHHPVEIAATLKAARGVANATGGKVIAVVQPHRYTRLHALFNEFTTCFSQADKVIIADVYEAGETPIEGANKQHLVDAVNKTGAVQAIALPSQQVLAEQVAKFATSGDIVICLGAGSITYWARSLADELVALQKQTVSS